MDKIPFESQLQHIEDIKERNIMFHELSDKDKRKEIAFDLFNLLLSGVVTEAHGHYWNNSLYNATLDISAKELHEYLNNLNNFEDCSVCARGGLMLSQIRLGNTIDGFDCNKEDGNEDNLIGFSLKSMENMEHYYEQTKNSYRQTWSAAVPNYYNTTEPRLNRLYNICLNVIVNGDFNVLDKSDYVHVYDLDIELEENNCENI